MSRQEHLWWTTERLPHLTDPRRAPEFQHLFVRTLIRDATTLPTDPLPPSERLEQKQDFASQLIQNFY